MKTNVELVDFVIKAKDEKWGYVWGTFGQILTPSLFEYKLKQYPTEVGKYYDFIKENWLNKRTCDCVGLIKAYMWLQRDNPVYDSTTDKSADGMYNAATEKGSIETMPEIVGLCVRYPGHIGVYIGDGQVIEARGTQYGVVQTKLQERGWTHWLKCPYIEYINISNYTIEDVLEKRKIAASALNIRTLPSTNGEIFGQYKNGEIVNVNGKTSNGWFRVIHNNKIGYIYGDYTEIFKIFNDKVYNELLQKYNDLKHDYEDKCAEFEELLNDTSFQELLEDLELAQDKFKEVSKKVLEYEVLLKHPIMQIARLIVKTIKK